MSGIIKLTLFVVVIELFGLPLLAESIRENITVNKPAIPQIRDDSGAIMLKHHDFFFSSAYVSMDYDADGDGYYSEFTVTFDADTNYEYADVYALLYLSYEGGPWELYYTTETFHIDGWSYYDDYSVSTLLSSGYPPGSYEVLIDLYDGYDHVLVATISSWDTYELDELYLEDITYDSSYDAQEPLPITESYSDGSGGAGSIGVMLLLLLLLMKNKLRRRYSIYNEPFLRLYR